MITDILFFDCKACAIKNHQNDELTHHQIFHFIVCTAIHDDWQTKPDTVVTQCITEVAEWPGDAESIEICSKDSEQANKFLGEFLSAAQEQKVNKGMRSLFESSSDITVDQFRGSQLTANATRKQSLTY